MSSLSKSVKIRFKKKPKGFVKAFERELEDKLEARSPRDTGRLESSNRVRSDGQGGFKVTNRTPYASYVDKSGPRIGGKGVKKWFTGLVNNREANKLARQVRNKLNKQQKKKGGKK